MIAINVSYFRVQNYWYSTFLFLLSTIFYFLFSHTTQHNIQNTTKQQTHTQHLKVQSKGRERGKDNKNTKVTPLYNHVYSTKNTAKHPYSTFLLTLFLQTCRTEFKNNEKMNKTFARRRHEIINQCPSVQDIKERWPALFQPSQVSYQSCLETKRNIMYLKTPSQNMWEFLSFHISGEYRISKNNHCAAGT